MCLVAQPDRALEARIGELVILPGECAVAPDPELRGRLPVTLVDGGGTSHAAKAKVRPEARTLIVVRDPGLPEGLDTKAARRPARCEGAHWPEPKP